jgi:hypothetical protein
LLVVGPPVMLMLDLGDVSRGGENVCVILLQAL